MWTGLTITSWARCLYELEWHKSGWYEIIIEELGKVEGVCWGKKSLTLEELKEREWEIEKIMVREIWYGAGVGYIIRTFPQNILNFFWSFPEYRYLYDKYQAKIKEEEEKKFIKNNNGKIWFLNSEGENGGLSITRGILEGDIWEGHAALFYIYNNVGYEVSFGSPDERFVLYSYKKGMFIEDGSITKAVLAGGKQKDKSIIYNIYELDNEGIDLGKLHKFVKLKKDSQLLYYSSLAYDCADAIEEILTFGGYKLKYLGGTSYKWIYLGEFGILTPNELQSKLEEYYDK